MPSDLTTAPIRSQRSILSLSLRPLAPVVKMQRFQNGALGGSRVPATGGRDTSPFPVLIQIYIGEGHDAKAFELCPTIISHVKGTTKLSTIVESMMEVYAHVFDRAYGIELARDIAAFEILLPLHEGKYQPWKYLHNGSYLQQGKDRDIWTKNRHLLWSEDEADEFDVGFPIVRVHLDAIKMNEIMKKPRSVTLALESKKKAPPCPEPALRGILVVPNNAPPGFI